MIEGLDTLNIDNDVFVPTFDLTGGVIEPKENVHVSNCFNKNDRFIFNYKQGKILNSINNNYDLYKFDLIHAHTVFTDGNCAYELSLKYAIPYIVAVRNTDLNDFFKYRINLRNRGLKILRNASAIVFLSESYKKELFNKYVPDRYKNQLKEKSIVIPNGIDQFWLDNKYLNRGSLNRKDFSIVYAGVINNNKNLLCTARAINTLNEHGFDIRYNVVGSVLDKSYYKKLMSFPFVSYTRKLSKEELLSIYRNNDIFVMPSKKESFGLVYAEAMTQGLPIIYSKGQGFDGQFDDGVVGYAVDSKNYLDLTNRLKLIIENYQTISSNCVKLSDKFSWDDICLRYLNLYLKILGEREST